MRDFVIVNDPHLNDQAPSSRTDNYTKAILDKLSFAVQYTIQVGGILLITGDFFHRKNPKHVSHRLVNKLIDVLSPLGKDRVYAIFGNHDIYSILSDLDSSPLLTLVKAKVVTFLNGKPLDLGDGISLNGVSWNEDRESSPAMLALKHVVGAKVRISLYHQYVIPAHIPFAGPHMKVNDVLTYLPDVAIFGHFHDGWGGALNYGGQVVINSGALAREKANKSNLSRPVRIGLLRLEGADVSYMNVDVPHRPAAEVFDLEKRAKAAAKADDIERFVKQFSDEVEAVSDVDLSSIEELLGLVERLQLESKIQQKISSLLIEANDEVNS
jgi:Icc-related predicted phosphoesterase